MPQIHKSAWFLVLLSAALQILIFPLPNLYMLCWVAITPLLVAILRARQPGALQLRAGMKLLPASPLQAFLLGSSAGFFGMPAPAIGFTALCINTVASTCRPESAS